MAWSSRVPMGFVSTLGTSNYPLRATNEILHTIHSLASWAVLHDDPDTQTGKGKQWEIRLATYEGSRFNKDSNKSVYTQKYTHFELLVEPPHNRNIFGIT